jgi:hypothetical protein
MRYAQVRLPEEEFIQVKKAALDAGMSLDEFMQSAIFEKMFADALKKASEEQQEEVPNPNPN